MFPLQNLKAKVHHLGQVFQEVGSSVQNLLIEKIAEEGTIGGAFSAPGRPQKLFAKYYKRLCSLAINFWVTFKQKGGNK